MTRRLALRGIAAQPRSSTHGAATRETQITQTVRVGLVGVLVLGGAQYFFTTSSLTEEWLVFVLVLGGTIWAVRKTRFYQQWMFWRTKPNLPFAGAIGAFFALVFLVALFAYLSANLGASGYIHVTHYAHPEAKEHLEMTACGDLLTDPSNRGRLIPTSCVAAFAAAARISGISTFGTCAEHAGTQGLLISSPFGSQCLGALASVAAWSSGKSKLLRYLDVYFVWNIIDALPGIDATKTLDWNRVRYRLTGHAGGAIALAFRLLVILPLLGLVVQLVKYPPPKHGHTSDEAAEQLGASGISPERAQKDREGSSTVADEVDTTHDGEIRAAANAILERTDGLHDQRDQIFKTSEP